MQHHALSHMSYVKDFFFYTGAFVVYYRKRFIFIITLFTQFCSAKMILLLKQQTIASKIKQTFDNKQNLSANISINSLQMTSVANMIQSKNQMEWSHSVVFFLCSAQNIQSNFHESFWPKRQAGDPL